jgi:hypothetical protein
MKQYLLAVILAVSSAAFAAPFKYASIDSPNLEKDARALLKTEYPSLTEHDVELLYGYVAVRLYNQERGIETTYIY